MLLVSVLPAMLSFLFFLFVVGGGDAVSYCS